MTKNIELSFEFFPATTTEAEEKFWIAIDRLLLLKPDFVSITYGAGGSTRDYTYQIAKELRVRKPDLNIAAHLTCVRSTRAEINEMAEKYLSAGINHIVALRGDPPKGTTKYIPNPEGYAYATDMIRGLKEIGDFEFTVAAFPEKHPESASFEQDIAVLQAKDELGAVRALTQFFFDDETYLRLRDRCHKAKIVMPIIPGIIPINNYANIAKFSAMCGTSIPQNIVKIFENLDENPAARDEAAIELATKQCQHLIAEGINKIHFYTMNRADLITKVCENL